MNFNFVTSFLIPLLDKSPGKAHRLSTRPQCASFRLQKFSCAGVFVCSRHFGDEYYKRGYNAGFADHMKLIKGAVQALKDAGHEPYEVI